MNSVKDIPVSIRFLTDSLAIIVFTVTIFPTSRMKSKTLNFPSHSALLTITAALSSDSKSRNRWSCFRMPNMLYWISLAVRRFLSLLFPDGSPTMAVAPPIRATGVCPACCRCAKIIIGTKLPTCRESEVGSKPIYTLVGFSANRSAVPGI